MHYDLEQEITGSGVILSFQAMKRGQTVAKRNVCAHIESLSSLASRSKQVTKLQRKYGNSLYCIT